MQITFFVRRAPAQSALLFCFIQFVLLFLTRKLILRIRSPKPNTHNNVSD